MSSTDSYIYTSRASRRKASDIIRERVANRDQDNLHDRDRVRERIRDRDTERIRDRDTERIRDRDTERIRERDGERYRARDREQERPEREEICEKDKERGILMRERHVDRERDHGRDRDSASLRERRLERNSLRESALSPTSTEPVKDSPPLSATQQLSIASLMGTGKLAQEIEDEFLICKICLDVYNNPKSLACLHTFCEQCIENHISSETTYKKFSDYRDFTCPLCRKRTQLPLGGVRKLPDNFLVSSLSEMLSRQRVNVETSFCEICKLISKVNQEAHHRCLECNKLLCKNCVKTHESTKVTKDHSVIDVQIEKDIICKEHSDEIVRFYCEPCQMCICILCTFNEHRQHEVTNFNEAVVKYKTDMEVLLEECKTRMVVCEKNIRQISKTEEVIRDAEQSVRDLAISFIAEVRQRERQLMDEIHAVYGSEALDMISRKTDWQSQLESLRHTCNLTEVILQGKDMELLLLKKELQEKLQSLNEESNVTLPETMNKIIRFEGGHLELGFIVDEQVEPDKRPRSAYKLVQETLDFRCQTTEDFVIPEKLVSSEISTQTEPVMTRNSADGTDILQTEDKGINTRSRTIQHQNSGSGSGLGHHLTSSSPERSVSPMLDRQCTPPEHDHSTFTRPMYTAAHVQQLPQGHPPNSQSVPPIQPIPAPDNNNMASSNGSFTQAGGELTASEKLIRARQRRKLKERSQSVMIPTAPGDSAHKTTHRERSIELFQSSPSHSVNYHEFPSVNSSSRQCQSSYNTLTLQPSMFHYSQMNPPNNTNNTTNMLQQVSKRLSHLSKPNSNKTDDVYSGSFF